MAEKDFIVKKGLQVGENIVSGGTVDGRTLSTDGAKLDGIAAGATNYGDSEVASYLSANSYATETYVTYATDGFITASYLTSNNYATQSYVQSQIPDTAQLEDDVDTATALALVGL